MQRRDISSPPVDFPSPILNRFTTHPNIQGEDTPATPKSDHGYIVNELIAKPPNQFSQQIML